MKKYALNFLILSILPFSFLSAQPNLSVKPGSFVVSVHQNNVEYAGLSFILAGEENSFKVPTSTCHQSSTLLFETDTKGQLKQGQEVPLDNSNFLSRVATTICNTYDKEPAKNSNNSTKNLAYNSAESNWIKVFYNASSDMSLMNNSLKVGGGAVSAIMRTRDLEVGPYVTSNTVGTLSFKLAQCNFTVIEATFTPLDNNSVEKVLIDPTHPARRATIKMCEMAKNN